MAKRVFFRADASAKVGLGHLTRCLALASMLREEFECVFLLKESASTGLKLVNDSKFHCEKIQETDLLVEAIEVAGIVSADIVVFDGYQFNEDYFKQIKDSGASVVVIDDFMKDNAFADVLINHAVGLTEAVYQNRRTKYCLGADYAMLRPPFLTKAKQFREINKVENVFICFGGADYFNITLKTLQALQDMECKMNLHLVLASTFPFAAEIKTFLHNTSMKVKLYCDLDAYQMCDLMSFSEVAIAPTSGLSYEICAVGVGFIGGYYIDNQKAIHDGFVKRNCLCTLGDLTTVSVEEMSQYFKLFFNDITQINNVIQNQKKIIDGDSSRRFKQIFMTL